MRLKSRKAELKQLVKVSSAKYVGMFRHDYSHKYKIYFHKHKLLIFRIPKNQRIPNTPSRCLNFSLFRQRSNQLKLFAREGRKKQANSSIID